MSLHLTIYVGINPTFRSYKQSIYVAQSTTLYLTYQSYHEKEYIEDRLHKVEEPYQ